MTGETEMVLRVARAISGAPFPSAKSIAKARAAIWALKSPTPETNAAICRGQPRAAHVDMQLGYERGLDAALGGGLRLMARRSARDYRAAPIDTAGYVTFPAKPTRKRRAPLSPGFHAEPGETKGHQHDIYTTIPPLFGWKRIHVGTLMKQAVDAWAATAREAERRDDPHRPDALRTGEEVDHAAT